MIARHPLTWPEGWPRMKSYQRKSASFKHEGKPLTVGVGAARVIDELAKMLINENDVVISTNVRTRLDGLPRSGEPAPADCGAAVYWETKKRETRVMAIDRYDTVADNLAAIAATLDAMRAIERHGGAQILDRAFTGFTALPAPSGKRHWKDVLNFGQDCPPMTLDDIKHRYRQLASVRHPDKEHGSNERMSELNVALAEAERAIGGGV